MDEQKRERRDAPTHRMRSSKVGLVLLLRLDAVAGDDTAPCRRVCRVEVAGAEQRVVLEHLVPAGGKEEVEREETGRVRRVSDVYARDGGGDEDAPR